MDSPTAPVQATASRHALGDLIWSPSRAARLLRRVAVSLAFLFGLVTLRVPVESLLPPVVYQKDFLQDYLLARAIAERVDPYLPIPVLVRRFLGPVPVPFSFPTPHPPTAGLLFLPLAFLSYHLAAIVWLVLEVVSLVASVYILGRIVGVRLGAPATLITATIALAWFPAMADLWSGQLMLPILLCLAGARRALQRDRRLTGGALVGLSILLKPIAWPVLLVFLVRRDWRALAAALSTTLLGYTAATGVIGIDGVLAYLTGVLPLVTRLYHASHWNISIWTIGWRVFEGTGSEVFPGISAPSLI